MFPDIPTFLGIFCFVVWFGKGGLPLFEYAPECGTLEICCGFLPLGDAGFWAHPTNKITPNIIIQIFLIFIQFFLAWVVYESKNADSLFH